MYIAKFPLELTKKDSLKYKVTGLSKTLNLNFGMLKSVNISTYFQTLDWDQGLTIVIQRKAAFIETLENLK